MRELNICFFILVFIQSRCGAHVTKQPTECLSFVDIAL